MRHIMIAGAMGALMAGTAQADCGIEAGSVRILTNDFEALRVVGEAASECAGDGVEVTTDHTIDHKTIQVPALTTDPATYTVAGIANNSLVPLLNASLVRPLDDLVAAYGEGLQDFQLVRMNEGVMAIAFMANGEHLFYREDLLEEAGVEPPTTMGELLEVLAALRENGMEHPFAANYEPGWDLAASFVNMYLGTGAEFFEPGSAELAIDGEEGRRVLGTMASLAAYMRPDFVTDDANTITPLFKEGELAVVFQWGSRARDILDGELGDAIAVAPMPAMEAGGPPAAALWWDGFSIARNVSDEDAEASFRTMMHALSPALMEAHGDSAVWLVEGYEPAKAAEGVSGNIEGGARSYPMEPFMGLLHTALSENLAEFVQGQEDADQALADIETAYRTAATEAGFLD